MNAGEATVPAAESTASSHVRATRIGLYAARHLGTKPTKGTIVSTFRGGFNLLLNEPANPALVSVQTADVPLHPWALDLDHLIASVIDWREAARLELRIQEYGNAEILSRSRETRSSETLVSLVGLRAGFAVP